MKREKQEERGIDQPNVTLLLSQPSVWSTEFYIKIKGSKIRHTDDLLVINSDDSSER